MYRRLSNILCLLRLNGKDETVIAAEEGARGVLWVGGRFMEVDWIVEVLVQPQWHID